MSLEDRVNEEMVIDRAELLEAEFDRAAKHIRILDSGKIILPDAQSIDWRNELLLYLVASEYAAIGGQRETPGLEYAPLYDWLDAGKSTIRKEMSSLSDQGFVYKDEEHNAWRIVAEQISEMLATVEETLDDT